MTSGDDDREELQEREYPEPDGEGAAAVPCPFCRTPVWDDADICPKCGMFIGLEDETGGRTWWFRATVLLCLGVVLFWIWAGW